MTRREDGWRIADWSTIAVSAKIWARPPFVVRHPVPPWGCPGGAGEEAEAHGCPDRPGVAGLPWLGRVGPKARIRDLVQPWTSRPVLDPRSGRPPPLPSPPLLVLSDPRFERIEGMKEGTVLCPSKKCSPRLQLTTDTAEAVSA